MAPGSIKSHAVDEMGVTGSHWGQLNSVPPAAAFSERSTEKEMEERAMRETEREKKSTRDRRQAVFTVHVQFILAK